MTCEGQLEESYIGSAARRRAFLFHPDKAAARPWRLPPPDAELGSAEAEAQTAAMERTVAAALLGVLHASALLGGEEEAGELEPEEEGGEEGSGGLVENFASHGRRWPPSHSALLLLFWREFSREHKPPAAPPGLAPSMAAAGAAFDKADLLPAEAPRGKDRSSRRIALMHC